MSAYSNSNYTNSNYTNGGYSNGTYSAARPQVGKTAEKRAIGLGWKRDLPDFRDKTLDDKELRSYLTEEVKKPFILDASAKLKKSVISANLKHCSPVEDQGNLGSCTAQAVVGMMEYLMRRGTGRHEDGSRLFVYKTTRNLLGWTGDTGAYLRTAIQAIATFGMPPEVYYPYKIQHFEYEPSAFLYSFAANYKALRYTRLDPHGLAPKKVLNNVRWALSAGFPAVFGFSVYSSLGNGANIPFPGPHDSLQGGHAVLAIGYDDDYQCPNASKGALFIRNSWGSDWGEDGYGYLPYDYIHYGLANDFWTCFKSEWINNQQFQ